MSEPWRGGKKQAAIPLRQHSFLEDFIMSTGPLGMIGSAAGSPLQQRQGAEKSKNSQDVADQARETQSSQKSENAAGIGETEQHERADDRDADGRRLWEDPAQDSAENDSQPSADHDAKDSVPRSKDTTGDRGNQLDASA